MFKHNFNIGLDLGGGKARLAWVQSQCGMVRLAGFDSFNISPGLVDSGRMNNPERIGTELRDWVHGLGFTGRRVTVAVPGTQTYMRRLTMPALRWAELQRAAYFQAHEFLPIPVDESALDMVPLRRYQDDQGQKVELFFAAVRRKQVEDMVRACTGAGLKPTVMEIESLALHRAWGGDPAKTVILLQVCSINPYITIFSGGAPLYHRSLNLGTGIKKPTPTQKPACMAKDLGNADGDESGLVAGIVEQVRDVAAYCSRSDDGSWMGAATLVLDGGMDIPGLEAGLLQGLGLPLELAGRQAAARIRMPDDMSRQRQCELDHEFALALGLALRGASRCRGRWN